MSMASGMETAMKASRDCTIADLHAQEMSAIASVEELVDVLANRLSAIRRTAPVEAPSVTGVSSMPLSSPIANEIVQQTDRLRALAHRVDRLLADIEL